MGLFYAANNFGIINFGKITGLIDQRGGIKMYKRKAPIATKAPKVTKAAAGCPHRVWAWLPEGSNHGNHPGNDDIGNNIAKPIYDACSNGQGMRAKKVSQVEFQFAFLQNSKIRPAMLPLSTLLIKRRFLWMPLGPDFFYRVWPNTLLKPLLGAFNHQDPCLKIPGLH